MTEQDLQTQIDKLTTSKQEYQDGATKELTNALNEIEGKARSLRENGAAQINHQIGVFDGKIEMLKEMLKAMGEDAGQALTVSE